MLNKFDLSSLGITYAGIQVRAKATGYTASPLSNTVVYGYDKLFTYELSPENTYYTITGVSELRPESLTDLIIPETYSGLPVRYIYGGAFNNASWLTSIFIPDTIIGITGAAFSNCTSLGKIRIPFIGQGVGGGVFGFNFASIFGVFGQGSSVPESLKEVVISGNAGVITPRAFQSCINIERIIIEEGVTEIQGYAFDGCIALKRIEFPKGLLSWNLTAFNRCGSLSELVVPSIEDYMLAVGESPIYDEYTGNTHLYIGESEVINLVIPDGITEVAQSKFAYFNQIESVYIPDSVVTVGTSAFYDCTGLSSVRVGAGVASILSTAFWGCDNIEEVYYPGNEQEWNSIDVASGNDTLLDARIYFNTALMLADGKYEVDSDDNNFNVQEA